MHHIATENALGIRTSNVYDGANRRLALIDGNSNRHSFVYDAAGREVRAVNPLSNIVTSSYDAAGRKTLMVNARGQRMTYTFDAVGSKNCDAPNSPTRQAVATKMTADSRPISAASLRGLSVRTAANADERAPRA